MKTEDLKTVVTVALGTAVLTVMAFWSGPLEAGNEGTALSAKIAKPKLVSHGLELTLTAADGQTLQAGEEPTLTLTAVNPTGEPATAAICVEMSASSPADMLSRVPRRAAALWQQYLTLSLKPNETKVVTVPADKKLPANSMVAVFLRATEPAQTSEAGTSQVAAVAGSRAAFPGPSIVALNFSTIAPAVQTASIR